MSERIRDIQIMWANSKRPVKMFRNNKLDKDVQGIVQPFNIMFSLILSSKYKIRNGYITPCDKKYQILLFLIVFVFKVLSVYNMFNDGDGETSEYYYNRAYLISFFSFLFCYLLIIFSNLFQSHSNISLILKIQEIHRKSSLNARSFIITNWILFPCGLLYYLLPLIFCYTIRGHIYFADFSVDLQNFANNLNMVYNIRLMALLTMYLEEWVTNVLRMNNEEENVENRQQMFVLYQNILEAYKLQTKIFQALVCWWLFIYYSIALLNTSFRLRLRPRGIHFPCASLTPPYYSRWGIFKHVLLVLPYTPQPIHMPSFRFLLPVISAVRCLSVTQ